MRRYDQRPAACAGPCASLQQLPVLGDIYKRITTLYTSISYWYSTCDYLQVLDCPLLPLRWLLFFWLVAIIRQKMLEGVFNAAINNTLYKVWVGQMNDVNDTHTICRWAGKLKRVGTTPSLRRTVCPVLSKSSSLKWLLQSWVRFEATKPFLLTAISHLLLLSVLLGNLKKWKRTLDENCVLFMYSFISLAYPIPQHF